MYICYMLHPLPRRLRLIDFGQIFLSYPTRIDIVRAVFKVCDELIYIRDALKEHKL